MVTLEERLLNSEMSRPDLAKGIAVGLVSGLVASWVMNQFQSAWSKRAKGYEKPHGAQSMQPSKGEQAAESSSRSEEQQDDATTRTAKLISQEVFGHELPEHQKKAAGALVHYVFGIAMGGFYGGMAELAPQVTKGAGVPFGAVFWVLADETVVPLLGLSKGPSGYRLPTHLYALSSHVIYGVTAETTRRVLRRTI